MGTTVERIAAGSSSIRLAEKLSDPRLTVQVESFWK
jgi:hypothetical protein